MSLAVRTVAHKSGGHAPAWWIWVTAIALTVASTPLSIGRGVLPRAEDIIWLAQSAAVLGGVGLLIVRRPRHRFAPVLALTGAVGAIASFAHAYAVYPLPYGAPVLLVGTVVGASLLGLMLVYLPLLFPDGRLPSRGWAPVGYAGGAGTFLLCGALAIKPGDFEGASGIANPLGTSDRAFMIVNVAGMLLMLAAALGAIAALVARYRRGSDRTRVQVRWLTVVLALLVSAIVVLNLLTRGDRVENPALDAITGLVLGAGLPLVAVTALLHDDVAALDRLIRRSLVYGTLWLVCTLLLLSVPLGLGVAASDRLPFSVAVVVAVVTTLVVQPIRVRLLQLADRLAVNVAGQVADADRRAARLDASRARIVSAAAAERRRIQRDLHDGAQQELLAMIARIRLVRERLDPDAAERATLAEVQEDARRALEGLRDLAHGLHPPLLTDQGIVSAVEDQVGRLPVEARVCADSVSGRRYAEDIESAAYFVVSEALANVLKHARARRVEVRLEEREGSLRIEVFDDGLGAMPGAAQAGSGLAGLADRVDAVGGALRVARAAGGGTRVCARLPARPPESGR